MIERPPYKLRSDLVIQRRVFSGNVKYVVKDPLRLDYFTIDETSYLLLSLCDGKKDLAGLIEEVGRLAPGLGLDGFTLLSFYENYRKVHFFEDSWERNILLIEKQRASRSQAFRKAVANPLEITFPAWNPDRFFNRIVRPLGFLFTRGALLAYAAIFLVATWITVANASEFALPIHELWVIQGKPFLGIVTLWFVLLFTVLLHEIGHGLTCKHYGGGVYRIGFLLLYFNPCLYCDVTEGYFFENKNHKHAVTLAGGIVDLVVASFATFVWFFTSPDLFVNEVAHRIAIFAGITGLIVNMNPLLKYDGYFLLSDHLEIPDLRGEAFKFIGAKIRGLFGLATESALYTSREKRIFWTYGILAALYSIFVIWFVMLFVGGWLVAHFRAVGYILMTTLFLLMTQRYWKGLGRFLRFAALDKAGAIRRRRGFVFGGAALVLALLLVVPFPRHVRGRFVFRPGQEIVLRAGEAGWIEQVFLDEGDVVAAGKAPLVLRSDELGLEEMAAGARLRTAEVARTAALVDHDRGAAWALQADVRENEAVRDYYSARGGRLLPASPIEAIVLTPRLRERTGAACAAGDTLVELGDLSTLKAHVSLDEGLLGLVRRDRPAGLRTHADPGDVRAATIATVAPEASGGTLRKLYRIELVVDNADGALRPGMTGEVRFDAGSVPLAAQLLGATMRALRIEFWI